ncbi:MAG: polysaccharide deacetylase family protein [Gammaproteobacteria bacterium]|nr:polysaccharide deacetylase family protein [Gammaproteobacteria bacterium]
MIGRLCALTMRAPRHQTLMFHRVLKQADPMLPTEPVAGWFDALIGQLSRHYDCIPLGEAVRRAEAGELSGRTLSITFDDGYADNFHIALPILERHRVPATFFVASGFLDGGMMWNDRIIESVRRLDDGQLPVAVDDDRPVPQLGDAASRRQVAEQVIVAWKHLPPTERQRRVDELVEAGPPLPGTLMMTSDQLREMAASSCAEIGGHTRTHPILTSLDDTRALAEIVDGKRDLEAIIGQQLSWFAYPNGKPGKDYAAQHVELVREAGFDGAVSTEWGTYDSRSDAYQVPRFTPWSRNLDRFSLDLARCHYGLI